MADRVIVYMDACCFIDMAKHKMSIPTEIKRAPHIFFCRRFIDAARVKDATVYTSTFTVVECVKVVDKTVPGGKVVDDERVKELFRGMLMSGRSGVMPVTANPSIIETARDLRWHRGITCKPMDAVHLATALSMKCTHYLTTDERLGDENVKKISGMGLTVCSADQAVHLLPDDYKQQSMDLAPKGGAKQESLPSAPPPQP